MFEYDGLRIRAVEEDDLMLLYNMRRDEQINDNLFYPLPVSLSGQKKWLESMNANQKNKVFMIEYQETINIPTGEKIETWEAIGCIRLADIDHLHQTVEIGADICEQYRGLGLATRLYAMITDYCFTQLNMQKCYLYVLEKNQRAIHVYNKCGFEIEGTLKKHKFKHGKYQTILLMSQFREEQYR